MATQADIEAARQRWGKYPSSRERFASYRLVDDYESAKQRYKHDAEILANAFAHTHWPAIFDTIDRQAKEIERLTRMVNAVHLPEFGDARFDAIDGKSWFDLRDEINLKGGA